MKHNLLAGRPAGRQWLYQYDLLRIILVALVVIGHAAFITIHTKFGSIEYGTLLTDAGLNDSIFHRAITLLSNWVYSFHMPLFIALSGTIYGIQKERGSYQSFKQFICSKAKRLLIPLFVVWWLYRFSIMYFTGFYNGVPAYRLILQMLAPNCVYLWYLEALFLIFVIIYALDKVKSKVIETGIVAVLYLIGLILYKKFSAYHFLGDPLYYLLWFYIGMHAERLIKWLEDKKILSNTKVCVLILAQLVLFILKRNVIQNKLIIAGIQYVSLPFLMVIVMYFFVNHYQIRNAEKIHAAASYCMGIYLYAEPLNYMLLYLFYTWFGIGVFGSEIGSMILWLLRVFLTTAVAIGITWLLKKLKLKYLY